MMMHRGKQGKNGRALRYSDLSLEGEGRQHQQGQPQVQNGVLHNGLRPYGGNKGTSQIVPLVFPLCTRGWTPLVKLKYKIKTSLYRMILYVTVSLSNLDLDFVSISNLVTPFGIL